MNTINLWHYSYKKMHNTADNLYFNKMNNSSRTPLPYKNLFMSSCNYLKVICLLILSLAFSTHTLAQTTTSHAIAMHGDIKYANGFEHFEYTNPDAPKGGTLKLGGFGSFDSFNPFIAKGTVADNIALIYDTLTTQSNDEPFTQYGLLAEKIETPEDRSWVIFHINPRARFHDGHAVTAEDVVFSFNLLITEGAPQYAIYYAQVAKVEALDKYKVKFTFNDSNNRELALIVGQLAVLPKHFWQDKDFSKSTQDIPLGSGPYKIKKFNLGRRLVFERVNNYWAKNLAVNKGLYNFDFIRFDYYKDSVALLEGLKSGEFDFRYENSSKQWATGYAGKAIDKRWLIQDQIHHNNPTGMQAFVMNLRNPLFSDKRVRQALNYAFDFEWTNKNLFYGAYARTNSYFSNSELASSGLPSGAELELLLPFKEQVPQSIFKQTYMQPKSGADGYNRKNLLIAKGLLEAAGWKVKDNILRHTQSGQAFKFELILVSPAFERIVNPYVQALKKLGIIVTVRHVEVAQYINRVRHRKFDMIVDVIAQSLSPGNEQRSYWHSQSADIASSKNNAGIKNPVVDALVEGLISAPDRASLIAHTRALDRVLLHNYYVIPHWHSRVHRIAYWNKFSRPQIAPKYDSAYSQGLMSWWYDENKTHKLNQAMGN